MSDERGFALVTVVLLTIGLAVLAMAHAFVAAQQATLVGSMHDVLRARHAAEAGVVITQREWNAVARSLDPIGEPVLLRTLELEPGLNVTVTSERRAAETFLLVAQATVDRAGLASVRHSAARVVRSLDAGEVLRALDAALIAGSVLVGPGSTIAGAGAGASADTVAAALCAATLGEGAALRAPPDSVRIAGGAQLSGTPLLIPEADPSRLRAGIGSIDLDELRARARVVDDVGSLPPDPFLGHAPADLGIRGGDVAGVLIVDGDLELDQGARFRGILIVLGTATIGDARVEGVLLAGAVRTRGGSATLDRCAIAENLAALEPTRRAYLPTRSWLPSFD